MMGFPTRVTMNTPATPLRYCVSRQERDGQSVLRHTSQALPEGWVERKAGASWGAGLESGRSGMRVALGWYSIRRWTVTAWVSPSPGPAGQSGKRKRAIDQTFPSESNVATMLLRPMAPPRRGGAA